MTKYIRFSPRLNCKVMLLMFHPQKISGKKQESEAIRSQPQWKAIRENVVPIRKVLYKVKKCRGISQDSMNTRIRSKYQSVTEQNA